MYFRVLGPLSVLTTDGGPVRLPETKIRALLADLLVHAGRPVAAERLVDDLWGDAPPRNPAGALQTKVSRLRAALAGAEPSAQELVVSRAPGYLLRVAPHEVDAARFADLTTTAYATADPATRAGLLADALALWHGDAYAGLTGLDVVRAAAQRLEEQRLTAVESLAAARLELGEQHAVSGELAELTARHPLRERLWAVRMRALYAAGRQSEALAAYAELRGRLAEELGVDPGAEVRALHQAILTHDPSLTPAGRSRGRSRGVPRAPLPEPLTGLVGRDDAVAAVRELLAAHRLVTLTGAGGVGKTRLAVKVARDRHPEGIRFVELTGRASAEEQVSAALGVREEGALGLVETLRSRRMLLVLDNCEHIAGSVADLAGRLLSASPELRVLATGREPLGLAGEAVWTVPPLRQADAERLFTERARAALGATGPLDLGGAAVAAICRRLDRIPLALELAATRVRALGVDELAARLGDDRFAVLDGGRRTAPPRHRTLRAVIDWSWELLTDDERVVLRRLAVHAGGCTLQAAEAVCDPGGRGTLGPLTRLVDRSLVTVTDGPRYRLLESVSAYALERLEEAGDAETVRRRHQHHYTEQAERAADRLHGPGQAHGLRRIDEETANLRAALAHAVRGGDADGALRLVLALTWPWFLLGRLSEARRSLVDALAVTGPAPASLQNTVTIWHAAFALLAGDRGTPLPPLPSGDPPVPPLPSTGAPLPPLPSGDVTAGRAGAGSRAAAGRAAWFLGHALLSTGADLSLSERWVEWALAVFERAGDAWGSAAARSTRAVQGLMRGDLAAARADGEQAYALFRSLGDRWGELRAGYPLAALAEVSGDYEQAELLHRDGLRLAQELGFWTEAADRLVGLGRIALLAGDLGGSRRLHEQAARLAAEHAYRAGEIHALIGLALVARRAHDLDNAERHLLDALEWHRRVAFGPGPALLLAELGFAAEQRGDAGTALARHREGLEHARAGGDPRAVALAYEGLAGAHALAGRPQRAARLLGAAARLRADAGAPLPPAERGDADRATATAVAALGREAFDAEYGAGFEGASA
ncbi:BTAD domain-containing putative transcriptional regulator [Nonomuraea diastatica]|uniref:AfsR/SARP family transcriptional regulator n=1 Tax=Nonomuraea diastatica TaxID=1848329 RepID=A0A4R4X2L5_9ACTN|nr:BTAD domain-containing putative transcriptional regulator [Nonomuraea diastatica]TDD24464.1 AfsR/SARP family transcriptional regulator [Nonomuraea diastatica]